MNDNNESRKSSQSRAQSIINMIRQRQFIGQPTEPFDEEELGNVGEFINNLSDDDYIDLIETPVWKSAWNQGYEAGQRAAYKSAQITISGIVAIFTSKN
mgnify:CR=1 FL=1